ncbi:MAG TPA: FemAB family XrtA/PEP-CTERM system-associated protein [Gemmatimonas sp.]|uniref:FemAB family XrtA/PEP-CTERM system-associated protein n=1 Tax=Gemmatimonas sp. TaxID=1962908 RepID=UPI002EDB4975
MSKSASQITIATPGDAAAWNAFVDEHAHGSTFHRFEWRDVYRDVYGHDTPYLMARRDGALVGVLPLVRVRSLLFGHYLVSSPFVSYGGPIGDDESEYALSMHAAGMANGAKLVELRSRHAIRTDLTAVTRKLTVLLDLVPNDYEATFKAFDGKLRSQIRRADREGLRVEFGPAHLGRFHQVFAEHMRDLGSPAHGPRFFARLTEALGERAWVGVAYLGEEAVAAGYAIENGSEVEISWASSLRRHQKISPNMALYGAFIRRACERGFSVFNFGRCTPGSGTHKFKRQWGSRDEPLTWYQRSASGDAAPPSGDGSGYGTAVKVWQRLPLALTTPLGARLIGGVP